MGIERLLGTQFIMPRSLQTLIPAGLFLFVAGCALQPVDPLPGNACLRHFQAVDVRIDVAAARDDGAHRPPGFPWLRSTRFLASFRHELNDEAQWATWLEHLRSEDMAARRAELPNAGFVPADRELAMLDSCGQQLNASLMADHQARARLRLAAAVPADYSLLQRLFGAYPLALPFLKWGVSNYQQTVNEDYRRPLGELDSPGPLVLWQPRGPVSAAVDVATLRRNALGIPVLEPGQWQTLARQHAPAWWIETGGEYDRPGAPAHGLQGPGVRVEQPVVYFKPAYVRWRGAVLIQLVYAIWFDERPRSSMLDPYAGRLDGVIWRVTLDVDGQPLFYDSVHSCGCYYRVYPGPSVRPRDRLQWDAEPLLFFDSEARNSPVALRLQSGSHYLRRVVDLDAAHSDQQRHYDLRAYSTLLSLPTARGVRRSLFGVAGLVPGSERTERWWLWPSGVPSPGAMRQWGRHAIAFTGQRHFDDPYLPATLFSGD